MIARARRPFRRRHQCVVVQLVTEQMQLDRHAHRPHPLRETDAVREEQVARAREDRHRREGAEGAVERADEGMAYTKR